MAHGERGHGLTCGGIAPALRGDAMSMCTWLGLVLLVAAGARAQPLVRVQARTQVALDGTHDENGLDLRGALLDDLGAPLAGRPLVVRIAADAEGSPPQRIASRSGEDGRFRVTTSLPAGVYRVRIAFAGDSHHEPSEAARTVDLTRADVRLRFIEPRALRFDLDAESHAIVVRASSTHGGAGLSVQVRDERAVSLAHGQTDRDGVFRAAIASVALGAPGSARLIAESEADALRGVAQTEISVLRWRGTRLSLQARIDRRREVVALHGLLRDSKAVLGDEAVGLFEGDVHLATVLTDSAGSFRTELKLPVTAAGGTPAAARLQARFDSDASWIGSSRSEVVEVSLAPDSPASPLWLLGPLCLSGALVWFLLRRPAAERADRAAPPTVGIGIHPGRGRARGRAQRREIDGAVRDAETDRAVRGAILALCAGDGSTVELPTNVDGTFRSPQLGDGTWTVTIAAEGYAPLTGTLTIPHRGEWAGVQVQLQSLRSAAVMAYKPAALRMLPSAELWQRSTPRETLHRARQSGRATEPFVQLTHCVEHAAYARTPPSMEEVATIERVAAEAMARFPSAPSQPAGSGLLRAGVPHRR
jgi:Carboxypeptidase regulatory-like domain